MIQKKQQTAIPFEPPELDVKRAIHSHKKNELAEWPISDHCQLASSRVNVDGNEELDLESNSYPDPGHSISNQRSPSLTDRMVVVATVSNSNLMPSSRPRGRTNFFAELF